MIDKLAPSVEAALQGTPDGATVMIGGFGGAGQPAELIDALIEQGARELTIVNNNAGIGEVGLAALLKTGRVRKIICSFPRQVDSHVLAGKMRSAIQITTASSLCAMLDMLAQGRLPQAGFVKQEDVPLAEFLGNRFGRVYAMEELSKAA